jgi:hypothetical protein
MGTNYSFDGGVTIDPPLNYSEIRTARKTALDLVRQHEKRYATEENVFSTYMPLALTLDTFDKTTEEGVLTVTRAIALKAPSSEHFLPMDMDVLVRALIKALPGHNWTGSVTAVHEDRLTGYKLTVKADGSGQSVDSPEVVRHIKGSSYMVWSDNGESESVSLVDLI